MFKQQRIFIRLGVSPEHTVEWYCPNTPRSVSGTLAEAAEAARGQRVVVLVPAQHVLLLQPELPTRNVRQLRKALPYALEDQLADDIEHCHFALGKMGKQAPLSVAIVAHEKMQYWQDLLSSVQLRTELIFVESLSLAQHDNSWSLLLEEHNVTVRTDAQQGFSCEHDNMLFVLNESIENTPNLRLYHHTTQPEESDLAALSERYAWLQDLQQNPNTNLTVDHLSDPTRWMANHTTLDQNINLLQGIYSPTRHYGKLWKPWKPIAILAACWFALQVGLIAWNNHHMTGKITATSEQINHVYRQTFPEARRIVNAKVQMERRLKTLSQQSQSNQIGLLALLNQTIPLLKTEHFSIKRLKYRESSLELELLLDQLQDLDDLKTRVNDHPQLQADILSATTHKGKAKGRIRIRRKTTS
jgi:general secretion pathway protein L